MCSESCLYLRGAGDDDTLLDIGASSLIVMKKSGVDPVHRVAVITHRSRDVLVRQREIDAETAHDGLMLTLGEAPR
jgi:hypothetical protein